jgi:hypothetical protein
MIKSLIIAITSITLLIMVWVTVQTFWKKTFQDYISDEDVLAERRSCKNCGCTEACENKRELLNN